MTNFEIETQLLKLVRDERNITNEILALINLADGRKLYLEKGYSSLFEWLTQTFGYSEAAAQRRIQAARLLRAVPDVAPKIASGEVNLTTLAKAQSVIRLQERVSGEKLTVSEKAHVVATIENKSAVETEKTLMGMFPLVASKIHEERATVVSESVTRLAVNLPNSVLEDLKRVQELLSHAVPGGSLADVIDYLAKDFIKRKDPRARNGSGIVAPNLLSQTKNSETASPSDLDLNKKTCETKDSVVGIQKRVTYHRDFCNTTLSGNAQKEMTSLLDSQPGQLDASASCKQSAKSHNGLSQSNLGLFSRDVFSTDRAQNTAATKRRVTGVSAKLKRAVLERSEGQCTFKDYVTGKVCGSSYQVEVDHIYPRALGGEDSIENLRCLCRAHNQFVAAQVLGSAARQRSSRLGAK